MDDGGRDFDGFYPEQYPRMLALAYALTGDRGAAEDLVQDAFVSANRRWDRVGTYDLPAAFVRRAIVNRSRSRWRSRRREADALARVAARPVAASPDGAVDVDAFWEAVRTLPEQQCRCVVLRYVEDLDTATIASTLGCAASTVRVHLHRARQTLATRLGMEAE